MSKRFFAVAFATGLAAIVWVGLGFVGSSWIALAMTAVIGGVYLLGAFELRQFRAASAALASALAEIPDPLPSLGEWLDRVPASLRNAVRLRVEGERAGLPGPALTPYLVGLLVMLGMLGTFLGMVVTFKGAVFALQGSADLQAMRSALAEPIKGLGLAFGTSVAGVAASAMLGLMSAIARRERQGAGRQLDTRIATSLRPFSLVHQRQETYRALQAQATALPMVVDKLEAMMERIERRSQQLDEQLLGRQARFHGDVTLAYTGLAEAVAGSLQDSLAAGARAAGESITPVVESAMARIVQETQRLHERVGAVAQTQADAFTDAFEQRSTALIGGVTQLLARSEDLVQARAESEARWVGQHGQRMDALEAAVAQHLATLGTALEAPITRLLHTAAEVPQAAAGVLVELRRETSALAERDNLALQERTGLLEQLGTVLQVLEAQAGKASDVAAHVTGSAVELASLGEAFGHGVQLFQASNDKLMASLQGIETSLNRSTARSDEQLAYYVAQAREVIDLSIASQQGLVDHLRQLQGKPVALVHASRA